MRSLADLGHDELPFFSFESHHSVDVLDRTAERIGDLYAEEERRERLARVEEIVSKARELWAQSDSA